MPTQVFKTALIKSLLKSIFSIFFLLILNPSVCHGDWINLSGAENSRNIVEIYIEKDHVRMQLEIFVQDIFVFEELIPAGFFPKPIPNRPTLEKRQQIFAEEVFQVIADNGEKLPVTFALIEPRTRIERPSPFVGTINPYTRQVIPGPPDDKRVLYAELIYPFKEQPKSLKFLSPRNEKGFPKVSIGFLCYHEGVQVVDFRMLAESNLHLDWDDAWYSEFDTKGLQRTIGTGMRTFLYIEPYEVRNEILVRVKDMMAWMDFSLRGNEYIEEDEFNRLREQIGQFFLERENVLIDGKRLKPILDSTAFVESSMLRSRFIEIPERIPLNTAMIGIIITYLTEDIPQEVTTQWNLFSNRVKKVTARMIDPAGPFPYDLEPDRNVLKWNNYLKNYTIPTVHNIAVARHHRGFPLPLASGACFLVLIPVGIIINSRIRKNQSVKIHFMIVGLLSVGVVVLLPFGHISVGSDVRVSQFQEEDGKAILHSLLKNVYRSFDFRNEEDVYDKLAISVSGDLLAKVYLDHRKSMSVQQAGGAQAKVEELAIESVSITSSDKKEGALDFHAVWNAMGTVGHWGHNHARENRYDAVVTLKPVDGSWKIVDLDLLEEKRIVPFGKK